MILTVVHSLMFILFCLFLAKAGNLVIRFLIKISNFLNWKKFTVASLIMTVVSSLPEIFVGVSSALHNKPQLSLGNVMGSNIIVLTLVIGICGLAAKKLSFTNKTIRRASLYAAIISPLSLFLMLDGRLTRWDGLILIAALFFYFHQLLLQEKRFSQTITDIYNSKNSNSMFFLRNIAFLIGSILLLLISAEGIVWSASRLAEQLNISLPIIGLLLIALGTSVPELSFGLRSIFEGHEDMMLGDAIGSVVINSALVIGMMSLIQPFSIPNLNPHLISVCFTIVIALSFAIFAKTDHKISQKESIFLIFLYILFLLAQLFISQWLNQ